MVLMRSPPLPPPHHNNTTASVALDRWTVNNAEAVALTLEERLFRILLTSTLAFLNTKSRLLEKLVEPTVRLVLLFKISNAIIQKEHVD